MLLQLPAEEVRRPEPVQARVLGQPFIDGLEEDEVVRERRVEKDPLVAVLAHA